MPTEKRYSTLARNLCAAYTAHRMGISLAYALKTYVSDEPGEYWFALAEVVEKDMVNAIDRQLRAAEERAKPKGGVQ